MVAGDDADRPVSLGREGEANGGYRRKKKKGQSRYKKCNPLRVHKKNIIFYMKSWFSDFIKLGSEKYIFAKWPHQNANSEIFFLNNYFFIYKMSYYLNKNMKGLI